MPEDRLPFDVSRMAGPAPAAAPSKATQYTVSQLAVLIDQALKDRLPTGLKVLGEIGRFTERTHWYFDIKDSGAVISCVMWQSAARKVGFVPQAGQQVLLTGRVEHYAPHGRTQFIADKVEPVGAGALDLAYRRLVEELRGLGWFAEDRKRPVPLLPRRVAVVTSKGGAALQDVIDTVARRCPTMQLSLVDVRVQGADAAPQVSRAIHALGRHHARLGVDVILVTRGGGSLEDLWAFNERIVAEAIVRSPIPVVAAIGHETDTTIAELVADLRCATPTQAAMRIAPDAAALRRQLGSVGSRLAGLLGKQIRLDAERLRSAARHSAFTDPARVVEEKADDLRTAAGDLCRALLDRLQHHAHRLAEASQRLNSHRPDAVYARREAALTHAGTRLRSAMAASTHRRSAALEASARSLDLVGPHNVLKRGYSVTLKQSGEVVRSATQMRPGDPVRTRLADGAFASIVTPEGATHIPLRSVPPARRLKKTDDRDQLGLF